jgi:putative ABC transport system permease protein
MPAQLIPKVEDALAAQQRIEQSLRTIAGVTGVSAASSLPLTASARQMTLTIPGAPGLTGNADRDAVLVDYLGARAEYPHVLGMRIVEGRSFEPVRRDGVLEGLIDRRLARQFFPRGGALGAKIPLNNDEKQVLTVVGVVEQARLYVVHQDGRPQVYMRAEDFGYRSLSYVVRTTRDPMALVPEVRAAIRSIDPRVAVADLRPMDEIVADVLRRHRISAVLISAFAGGALLLAGVGLFGIVSGSVTRRRHELALRLAVGADYGRLIRLVLAEGAVLVIVGMAIGAPVVYMSAGMLRSILVGMSPLDPPTLLVVAAGLTMVALAACYIPARRVFTIDPAQSLRQE